jgi:hypothetical protein
MKAAFLIATSLLAGCATSSVTYLPDGGEGHSIECSGTALSWAKCEQKAGEICKTAGYEVLSRTGDSQSTIGGGQFGVYGGTYQTRSMLVKCSHPGRQSQIAR